MINRKKGFTLVELLAVIVIIGILSLGAIKGVQVLIDRSRKDQRAHQESTLKMAAESYFQANRGELPKAIGESTTVSAETLQNTKYLKEAIKDSRGKTCFMDKSYVKIHKVSNKDYEYETHLFCEGDTITEEQEEKDKPEITVLFTDSSGKDITEDADLYQHVSDAYLKITIKGSSKNSDVAIEGYYYLIYAQIGEKSGVADAESGLNEVFNSGTLSGNEEPKIEIPAIKLADYIDITRATSFKVKVVAINTKGGRQEKIVGEEASSSNQATYNDTTLPKCEKDKVEGEAKEGEWINKANYRNGTVRTITMPCTDGTGSGCIRDKFVRSWPNQVQPDAEWGYIQVTDNAGNKTIKDDFMQLRSTCSYKDADIRANVFDQNCRVRVNVDITAPTVKVAVYERTSDENLTYKGNDLFISGTETTADDNKQEVTILSDKYDKLKGTGVKWMNNNNYPHGVVYEAKVSDNIHLKSWKWETNEPFIEDRNSPKYSTNEEVVKENYNLKNKDATSGVFKKDANDTTKDCGKLSETIKFGFVEEGLRKGILTVIDEAGNETKFYIEANIDRTAPPVPQDASLVKVTGEKYTEKEWSNKHVIATADSKYKVDNLSNNGQTTLSGFEKFIYYIIQPSGTTVTNFSQSVTFDHNYQGQNQLYFRGCDKADNCSDAGKTRYVWIDTIAPPCEVKSSRPGANAQGWQGKGEKSTVTATCTEQKSTKESGCLEGKGFHVTFDKVYEDINLNTTVAGAIAVGNGGQVSDVAGNVTNCAANQVVKMDKEFPTCTASGDNAKWKNSTVTLKWGCSDTGGSGCMAGMSGGSKAYSGAKTVKTETIGKYDISDNADNVTHCAAVTRNVYYDGEKPSCTPSFDPNSAGGAKTSGVTITYTCADKGNPNSGIKTCPKTQKKQTSTQTGTVVDGAGNSNTCKAKIHSFTEYRYKKKVCVYGCDTCHKTYCVSNTGANCGGYPRKSSQAGCSVLRGGCSVSGCTAFVSCPYNCHCSSCYTKKCGSKWTNWGHSSTGCSKDSRVRYYGG